MAVNFVDRIVKIENKDFQIVFDLVTTNNQPTAWLVSKWLNKCEIETCN